MSWQASAWAKKCRTPSPTHKLVLLIIADYATEKAGAIGITVPDGRAVCWAGVDEIAADCDVSPRTVLRALADLEAGAFIHRDRRYGRNSRAGEDGQPKMVRTTDAIWIDYTRPFVLAPADEAKRAAKSRAGRAGGKVSAARRAAEREALNAAAQAVNEALQVPAEEVPQVTSCLALGDILLGPQVTPSVTAEPSVEPPTNRQQPRARFSGTDRAREAPEEDHPMQGEAAAADTSPSTQLPTPGASRPAHRTSTRPPPIRKRRAWVDDGSGPEPARYRRPPTDPPEASP